MPEYRLSILHISDLHARSANVDELPTAAREGRRRQVHLEAAGREKVLGSAWDENLRELYANGERPDLVCFTGDVADWGLTSEYVEVTRFIDRLVHQLGVTRSHVYVVPGNHDVRRADPRTERDEHEKWQALRNVILSAPRATSSWLAGGHPPRALDAQLVDAVMQRTNSFWHWVKNELGRPELLPAQHAHRRLGYHHVLTLPHLPFPVHVIGLDSAWLAGDEHDQGKLWLTQHQRDLLLYDESGKPWSDGFRLALLHHPIEELAQPERDPTRRDLAATVHLLLHGHQHDPVGTSQIDLDGRTLRVLAAGCLFEGIEGSVWRNGCHRIDVTLDDRGCPLRAELHFRSWSRRGHWHSDSSLYRNLSNGRMAWHAWGANSAHEVEIRQALELVETRDLRKALGVLELKRQVLPELPRELRFLLLKGLGRGYFLLDDSESAARTYREAMQEAGEPPSAQVCEVRALMAEHSFDQAQEVVREALVHHPDHAELRRLDVSVAAEDETLASIEARLPPTVAEDPGVNAVLAIRASYLGEHEAASRYAQIAIHGGEARPGVWFARGNALLHPFITNGPEPYQIVRGATDRAQIEKAIECYDSGLSSDLGFPLYSDIVGRIYIQKVAAMSILGQKDDAIGSVLSAAYQRSPGCLDVRRSRALWMAKVGARNDAINLLTELVRETRDIRLRFELAGLLQQGKDPSSLSRASDSRRIGS